MGFVDTKDPPKIEAALREALPPEKSSDFCHRIVLAREGGLYCARSEVRRVLRGACLPLRLG